MTPVEQAALAWHLAGACVLPAATDGSKMPGVPSWKRYQSERPTDDVLASWPWPNTEGIGIVCGAVSGGMEMLEIEGKANDLITPFLTAIADTSPELLTKVMTYVEVTPSGGYHFVYRVDGPVAGNTKLASRPATVGRETLLETRGEAGWTVMAPSAGSTHPSGRAWRVEYGTPGVVATLTAEERDVLHLIARTFDQMPQVVIEHREALPVTGGELTPGQDYEARTTWHDILVPEGWTLRGRQGDKELWTRPGKDRGHGNSATTNYDGNDNLYVFTSSTAFEPMASYTKFGAYAQLHHNGDYSAAARELRRQGYGTPTTPTAQAESRATLSLIQGGQSPTTSGANALAPEESSSPARRYPLNDSGNARRLIDLEAPRLRYSPERREWVMWDGSRWAWRSDDSAAIYAMWRILEVSVAADPDEGKWLFKSLNEPAITRAVRLARAEPAMQVRMTDLDAHPYELNTPSGVVDLRTSEVGPPDPERLHTRMTGVAMDTEASPWLRCGRWLAFLAETFSGDAELIEFVQRLAGYSATGKVTHHVLPFLHGGGANGKSVFLEVLMALLGTYAGPAPADFLLAGANVHESYTADLAGLRLVVCSEVGPTAKFNEQKIKHLTGGDEVKARFLYGKPFRFSPTHHMWLMGNHQPRVDAGGESFWRRLRLVPFLHTVPQDDRIEGLAAQLVQEEGPAILAWIVEGARKQLAGLAEPESVKAATSSYAEEEDHLGRFIEERVKFGGGDYVRLSTTDMRHAYEQWCFGEGEHAIPANVFGRELKQRGAGSAKSNGRRFYTNVTLMKPEDSIAPRPEQLRYGV